MSQMFLFLLSFTQHYWLWSVCNELLLLSL